MSEGWIKLHRCLLDNPIVSKDGDHIAVWVYLLLNATHKNYPALFKGKKIELKPGQLITGRRSIASALCINESKVRRILEDFESDQQIDRQRSNQKSLISIVNWTKYQSCDQQNEQQLTSQRPTTDQPVTTNKNVKNVKNKYIGEIPPSLEEVAAYCASRNNGINPQSFIDFYQSKGWMIGKNKMKDWKASVRTWERKMKEETPPPRKKIVR